MTERLAQIALMGVLVLAVASLATAQQVPQPVVRLGNFLEVGNDVWMHIIASIDARYITVHNRDFESRVRDRVLSRFPGDTASQVTDSDASYAEMRLGAEFRYQKSLEAYLLFEHQQFFDGNLIDDRANSTTPGGVSVFGEPARTENPGFHAERYWIRYKFPGTPLKLHVGADLWRLDQAGILGDDDPRFILFGEFGDFDVMGGAVVQFESTRLGLENDNDYIYYTFSAGYNLKPHRFQVDVAYFRDRFIGADLANNPRPVAAGGIGFQGQKTDAVLLMGSWSGRLGPVRALIQGNLVVGTAQGGTAGLPGFPAGIASQRDFDIFAGAVVSYVEADLGMVRPFASFIYGSADGDPSDTTLHGFSNAAHQDISVITGTTWFQPLETSTNFADRDFACPGRSQGIRSGGAPAANPSAIGSQVLGGGTPPGGECSHTVTNAFNQRLANRSHPGLFSTYSNPGTLLVTGGLKVFPLKGHQLTGWYVYRAMVDSTLLQRAFIVGTDPGFTGRIGKSQAHEVGGFWMWTLNPHFDIRLAGNVAWLGGGFKDLARMTDCNLQQTGQQACSGDDAALKAEARFRARF